MALKEEGRWKDSSHTLCERLRGNSWNFETLTYFFTDRWNEWRQRLIVLHPPLTHLSIAPYPRVPHPRYAAYIFWGVHSGRVVPGCPDRRRHLFSVYPFHLQTLADCFSVARVTAPHRLLPSAWEALDPVPMEVLVPVPVAALGLPGEAAEVVSVEVETLYFGAPKICQQEVEVPQLMRSLWRSSETERRKRQLLVQVRRKTTDT